MSKEVIREPKLLNVLVFSDTSNASLCHERYLLKPRYKTRYMYLFLDNAIYLFKTCVPTSHEARYPIQENFSGGKKKKILSSLFTKDLVLSLANSWNSGQPKPQAIWQKSPRHVFDSLSQVMTYNHCQCSRAFPSSPCLPQSKLNYKLEKSCSEIFPSWGWMSVTFARIHFIRIPQLLVSCQSQLHQWLRNIEQFRLEGKGTGDLLFLPLNLSLDC